MGEQGPTSSLYIRSLDDFESKEIPGTQGAQLPFFSPDGGYIGFFVDKTLKKHSLASHFTETISSVSNFAGATWGNNDSIIVADYPISISSVSAHGGPLRPLSISKGNLNGGLAYPEWLPEYHAMIFTLVRSGGSSDLVLYDIKRREMRLLVEGGFTGQYANGYLIYGRQSAIYAAPFDLQSLTITGEEIPVSAGVLMYPNAATAHFAVGSHAPFLYLPLPSDLDKRSFAWVDRNGAMTELRFPQGAYFDPSLSPDGKRCAFHEDNHIWIADLERQTKRRVTGDQTKEFAPIWTPDGKRIVTSSRNDSGAYALVIRNVEGGAAEVLKSGKEVGYYPTSVSSDGKLLAYNEFHSKTGADIMIASLVGERKTEPFLVTQFDEENAMFSPDGHWIAYMSNESGIRDVYVARFPSSGNPILISDEGGNEPRWSRDGRELYFRNGRKMMMVSVDTKQAFHASRPKMLFEGDYAKPGGDAQYDVAPDGKRFLVMKGQIEEKGAKKINGIVNWQEEVRQKMERKK